MSSGRNRYSSAPMFYNGKNSPFKKSSMPENRPRVNDSVPQSNMDPASVRPAPDPGPQIYPPENQQQYSSYQYQYREPAYAQAANQNSYQQPLQQSQPEQTGNAYPSGPSDKRKKRPSQATWLQVALSVGLPILFVLALVLRETYLIGIAFIFLTIILIALMWITKAFSPNARKTLTTVYAALVIVAGVSVYMIVGNFGSASSGHDPVQNNPSSVQPTSTVFVPSPTDEPARVIASSGNAAKQQLETFISYWMLTQYRNCLEFCRPEWVANQQNAETSLFHKLGDIMPISYTIENIDGSEADTSRTVKLLLLGRNLQNQEVYYRYTILMLKSNSIWYVDPDSLSGILVTTQELIDSGIPVKTPVPTATPKPTPNPQMTLYYNPDGGQYYHVSNKCSSMDSKNQRKLQPFYYSNLNNDPFKNLAPCPKCGAPARQ